MFDVLDLNHELWAQLVGRCGSNNIERFESRIIWISK